MKPMPMIEARSPRKQELLNKFFWLKTCLFMDHWYDDIPRIGNDTGIETPGFQDVEDHRINFLLAVDDDFTYDLYFQIYQEIENTFMIAGYDIEKGMQATLERNGYTDFNQMSKPKKVAEPVKEAVAAGNLDPWD